MTADKIRKISYGDFKWRYNMTKVNANENLFPLILCCRIRSRLNGYDLAGDDSRVPSELDTIVLTPGLFLHGYVERLWFLEGQVRGEKHALGRSKRNFCTRLHTAMFASHILRTGLSHACQRHVCKPHAGVHGGFFCVCDVYKRQALLSPPFFSHTYTHRPPPPLKLLVMRRVLNCFSVKGAPNQITFTQPW